MEREDRSFDDSPQTQKKARINNEKSVSSRDFLDEKDFVVSSYTRFDESMKVEHIIYESGTNCVHECVRPCGYVAPTDSKLRIQYDENGKKIPAKEYSFKLDTFQAVSIGCLEIGESVLISAHTSAGKTCVAEYAIAMALKSNQRVVYTSPIKALSNQKYRDLRTTFGDNNVGLLTGDVTVNPLGSIMVMTTEILRSMLYRGSELVREIAWVIFDEIHYMRDKERGVVWEESIILLPDTVRLVFLSATIPNHLEFAEWICRTKHQPCHVVYTDYRPVPLQHFVFPAGGNGVYLVMDENKVFKQDNYMKALSALKIAAESNSSQKEQKKHAGKAQLRIDLESIVNMCQERSYLPIIVFSFSKKDCELNALSLKNIDLSTEEEKESIDFIFNSALATLAEEDRNIPQVVGMLPLLRRGIGIHHGGLLPVVKEIVELLFGESFIKVLFSTETFSMGINMPAKTVIFTSLRKFDGKEYRIVNSGEFIQMSGRAGRRGLDDRGITITMIDELADPWAIKSMLTGQPLRIDSQFYIGYNMLLNLLRLEGADPEYMINRSFSQFLKRKKTVSLHEEINRIQSILDNYKVSEPIIKIFSLNQEQDNLEASSKKSRPSIDRSNTQGNQFVIMRRKVEGVDDIYGSFKESLILPKFSNFSELLATYAYFLHISGFKVICKNDSSFDSKDFYSKNPCSPYLLEIELPHEKDFFMNKTLINEKISYFVDQCIENNGLETQENQVDIEIIAKERTSGYHIDSEKALIRIGETLFNHFCEMIELNKYIKKFIINSKIIHRFLNPGRLVYIRLPFLEREEANSLSIQDSEAQNEGGTSEMGSRDSNYIFYTKVFNGFSQNQYLDLGWGVLLSNPNPRNKKVDTGFLIEPIRNNNQTNQSGKEDNKQENETTKLSYSSVDMEDSDKYYIRVLLNKKRFPKLIYDKIVKEFEKNVEDSMNENSDYCIFNCTVSSIQEISTVRLNIPQNRTNITNKNTPGLMSLEISLNKVLDHLGKDKIPLINYYGDEMINIGNASSDSQICAKLERFKDLQKKIQQESILIRKCSFLAFLLLYISSHRYYLKERVDEISNDLRENEYDTIMQKELLGMRKVLKKLDYTDENSIVQLKGRIACEISTSDELLITELLFNNVFFQELKIEYIVAILSSLLYDEKCPDIKLEDSTLATGYDNILDVAKIIVKISSESGLNIDSTQYISKFRPQIMPIILKWSKGESFASILENTSFYEGSVIRCLRRLEELLRQVASATKSIGNDELEKKLKEGIALIKRGILFTLCQISKRAQAIIQSKPNGLLSEQEWRMLGVQQSRGWQHYLVHNASASPSVSTSLTAYSVASSTVSIYYMLTQTKRGPIGKILASIYLPIQKDRMGEYTFNIRTEKWDGDTMMVSSCMLYYFSLAVNPKLNNKYSIYSSNEMPILPWGEVQLNEDPLRAMTRIYDYVLSLKGGYIRIPLNNVDIWQLYLLGVIKKYSSMRNGKFKFKGKYPKLKKGSKNKTKTKGSDKEENVYDDIKLKLLENESPDEAKRDQNRLVDGKDINATSGIQSPNSENYSTDSAKVGQRATLDSYLQTKELKSSSSVISDFRIRRKHCIGGLSVVCKNKLNPKVSYISVPWIPGERTAFEEFRVINEYTSTLEGSSINGICKKNKLSEKLVNFSLALILYLRERQYDINYIDVINYKKCSFAKFKDKVVKFALCFFDFFGLAHGKNSVNRAPWKRILEEHWKLNPSKTLEYLIIGSHQQEVRSDIYSSSEWSEFDFAIAAVVYFFSIVLGIPILYGQYISKVSRRHFLVEREALNLQKYNVPVPHSAKYESE
ncbi:ATP-dependent RNA helicase [Cryptosporidium ubiquitum]|uniref:Cyclin-dependent kinases regulatory subunit n=1 Tax=Cryptosporidium ubiquitum TaxID=857276 RepID=A0A1J4MI33_9CRYT|nr:ATP-dependent RNA helicase [Cryptosporidium ubiquitum]OII73679.1 ATP-dependent RNA helicase [Cryptosporidium ubiquitum]